MEKRADIKIGALCNNYCRFCVQADNRIRGNRSREEIFRDIKAAKKTGCRDIVFTGGEVSIRDDFFELLNHAKELGFETIQAQTNGRRFYHKDFCELAVQAGLNEFAPAIHGHIPELHDFLTRSEGSFKQTIRGVQNMKELGIRIVTNTVVVKPNYRYCEEIAGMLVDLGVDQFQFAFVHPMGNAWENFDSIVPWISIAAPYIHKGLQVGIDAGITVMAEAMPFCMMEGYERYVSEFYIPPSEVRTFNHYDPDFEKTRKEQGKAKFPQCKECKFDLICEGPWREYSERRGYGEFKAVPGNKIKDREEILK